jgi:hypothetical protein
MPANPPAGAQGEAAVLGRGARLAPAMPPKPSREGRSTQHAKRVRSRPISHAGPSPSLREWVGWDLNRLWRSSG